MHATLWGLERPPFPTGTAEPVFYAGVPQREAQARMRFLVHNQRRLGLMLGESGWGKTLLLEMFSDECRRENWRVAKANPLGLSAREFQWQMAVELHAGPRNADDVSTLIRRLDSRLHQHHLQGESTVLLLDDVDQAGADVLTHVARFVQAPASQVGNLTLILTASSLQASRLGSRLLDLVDLRIDLEPWDADDTTGYLQLALVAAGAERPIFDDAALAEIYRLTQGIPRLVNRLADYALVAGSSAGVEQIDRETVAAAWEGISQRV